MQKRSVEGSRQVKYPSHRTQQCGYVVATYIGSLYDIMLVSSKTEEILSERHDAVELNVYCNFPYTRCGLD